MGCAISKAQACNPTLDCLQPRASYHAEPLEALTVCKQDAISPVLTRDDSAKESKSDSQTTAADEGHNPESVQSEESDVFTDDLSADSYESCDTQADVEPEEDEEIPTSERMRDAKFMRDAKSKVQRERSAAREKQKAEPEKEQAESWTIRRKARASRERARIEQRKAELRAKRAHAKEVAEQHETLREYYEDQVRLDKIKQTKKDESRYNYLKTVEHLERNDICVGKHIKEQIQMGFSRSFSDKARAAEKEIADEVAAEKAAEMAKASQQRLSVDLSRRLKSSSAGVISWAGASEHENEALRAKQLFFVAHSEKGSGGSIRAFVETVETQPNNVYDATGTRTMQKSRSSTARSSTTASWHGSRASSFQSNPYFKRNDRTERAGRLSSKTMSPVRGILKGAQPSMSRAKTLPRSDQLNRSSPLSSISRVGGYLSISSPVGGSGQGEATGDRAIRDDASVSRMLSRSLRRRSRPETAAMPHEITCTEKVENFELLSIISSSFPVLSKESGKENSEFVRNRSVDSPAPCEQDCSAVISGLRSTSFLLFTNSLVKALAPGKGDCPVTSGLPRNRSVDSLALFLQNSKAYPAAGHKEEENTTSDANEVLSALKNTRLEDAADKVPLYKQAFAILQPAFDKNIIVEGQMRGLIETEDELPFDFIVSLLLLYRREQSDNLELIRKAIYEGDSMTQLKAKVGLSDVRFLLHKIRGGAMSLGDVPVTEACSKLRQIIIEEDLEALVNGHGNWPDLVQASQVSASYFENFLKFVFPNVPH